MLYQRLKFPDLYNNIVWLTHSPYMCMITILRLGERSPTPTFFQGEVTRYWIPGAIPKPG